jgi:hypothetical protein
VNKRTLLAALLGLVGAALAKRKKAQAAERDLWHEAAQAPDLR